MRKGIVWGLFFALSLGTLLSGCNKKNEAVDIPVTVDASAEVVEARELPDTSEVLLGGWMVNDAFTDQLSEEDREIYENGIKGQSDYSYEPVSVLATQVVSGVNYAFLVYGNDTETVHAGGPSAYAVAIIWKDLNGTSTLMNLTQIDPVNIHTTEPVTGDLTGGWTVQGSGKAGMLPGEEIQTSFEDVTADLKVRLNPVVLIASQLVSGSNYIALSKGDDNNLYFTQWYRDLNGNASLTSNGAWDWEFYNP